jgi:DNA-binding GntR family transcriptional regulator
LKASDIGSLAGVPEDPRALEDDGSAPDRGVVTAVDRVYRRLRESVVDGEFPPGAPLRPDRLSRRYDVSLIPIREALRKLEMERLVEATPNKGVRVAAISVADLVDVYATRVVLELEALRRAWPTVDAAFIDAIRRDREGMVAATRSGDAAAAHTLHRRVHFALYERSGSRWLLHLIEILWGHTERYRRMVTRVGTFLDEDRDLHGAVIDAIDAGDRVGACEALRRDLERTRDVILAADPTWLRDAADAADPATQAGRERT